MKVKPKPRKAAKTKFRDCVQWEFIGIKQAAEIDRLNKECLQVRSEREDWFRKYVDGRANGNAMLDVLAHALERADLLIEDLDMWEGVALRQGQKFGAYKRRVTDLLIQLSAISSATLVKKEGVIGWLNITRLMNELEREGRG
jgi:hypothetical protein